MCSPFFLICPIPAILSQATLEFPYLTYLPQGKDDLSPHPPTFTAVIFAFTTVNLPIFTAVKISKLVSLLNGDYYPTLRVAITFKLSLLWLRCSCHKFELKARVHWRL
jgi:hypothetical protein